MSLRGMISDKIRESQIDSLEKRGVTKYPALKGISISIILPAIVIPNAPVDILQYFPKYFSITSSDIIITPAKIFENLAWLYVTIIVNNCISLLIIDNYIIGRRIDL